MKQTNCKLCDFVGQGKKLSNHIGSAHKMKSWEYTVQVFHDGKRPMCLECGEETRYVAWTFKRYCKDHSAIAEAQGGKKGGVANAWNKGLTKETDKRVQQNADSCRGELNHFFGKKHDPETLAKIGSSNRLEIDVIMSRVESARGQWEVVNVDEYYRRNHYIDFNCKTCQTKAHLKLSDVERGARCKVCDKSGSSIPEQEVADFVKSLGLDIVQNSRRIISPKELDIFVPSRNVAIEFHGLYWHSREDKDKDSHLAKWKTCSEQNIRLIQIFSDEWREKRQICESIIRHALNKTSSKLDARKCKVLKLDPIVARPLLDEWHLDGKTRSSVYFGLEHKGEIVSIMSLRTPFHKKHRNSVEIARFASRLNTSVRGAIGKLLKHAKNWAREQNKTKMLTYTDLRIGTGKGYESSGFTFLKHTGRNYWHTDGNKRFNRFAFKADKSRNMTEKQVCAEAGVTQVYGPGNLSFELYL